MTDFAEFNFSGLNQQEREDRLVAAKKKVFTLSSSTKRVELTSLSKLKSFRAKQNVLSAASLSTGSPPSSSVSIDSNTGLSGTSDTSINTLQDFSSIDNRNTTFPKRPSFSTPSFSQHQHKRSMSTAKLPPPLKLEYSNPKSSINTVVSLTPSPQPQLHTRKPSYSNNRKGHSHKRSKSSKTSKDFNKFVFGTGGKTGLSRNGLNAEAPLPASQLFLSPNPSPFVHSNTTPSPFLTGRSSPTSESSPNTWVFPRKNGLQSQAAEGKLVGSNNTVEKEVRTHVKRESRHARRSSVTTRAASMSLMGGVPNLNSKSPQLAVIQLPLPVSVGVAQDSEQQRRHALSKLEGRLREKREEIDLEGASERSISPVPSGFHPHSPMVNLHSNPASPAFVPSPKPFSITPSTKRNSWSGAISTGPFSNFPSSQSNNIGLGVGIASNILNETVASVGGKGANELGMLIEEEEEGEESPEESGDYKKHQDSKPPSQTSLTSFASQVDSQPQKQFTAQRTFSTTTSHQSFGSSESGRSRSSLEDNANSGKKGLKSLALSRGGSMDSGGGGSFIECSFNLLIVSQD
jgi:hypothetical protein